MGVDASKVVISNPREEENKKRFQEKRARLRQEYEQERAHRDPLEPFHIKKAQEKAQQERLRDYHQELEPITRNSEPGT